MQFEPVRMSGSCRSGSDTRGARFHAVRVGSDPWARALCGAKPGDGGNGWGSRYHEVTCPRCAEKLAARMNRA